MTSPALVVAPYEPYWQERGAQLAAEVRAALGPLALRVDHIGSTAVPGMAAKPVYDLQVSVRDKAQPGGERINLHCRVAGSPNERLALLVRDWLRAHPPAVAAYAAFKRVLAAAVNDIEVYTDVKDPVVDLVIVVAEDWAGATGWTP